MAVTSLSRRRGLESRRFLSWLVTEKMLSSSRKPETTSSRAGRTSRDREDARHVEDVIDELCPDCRGGAGHGHCLQPQIEGPACRVSTRASAATGAGPDAAART